MGLTKSVTLIEAVRLGLVSFRSVRVVNFGFMLAGFLLL